MITDRKALSVVVSWLIFFVVGSLISGCFNHGFLSWYVYRDGAILGTILYIIGSWHEYVKETKITIAFVAGAAILLWLWSGNRDTVKENKALWSELEKYESDTTIDKAIVSYTDTSDDNQDERSY